MAPAPDFMRTVESLSASSNDAGELNPFWIPGNSRFLKNSPFDISRVPEADFGIRSGDNDAGGSGLPSI